MLIDLNKPNGAPIKITRIGPGEFRSDSGYIFSLGQHSASFVNEKTGIFLNLHMELLHIPSRPVFAVEWPDRLRWSDETLLSDPDREHLQQIVIALNGIVSGVKVSNEFGN